MFKFEHEDGYETVSVETETFAKIAAIQAFCEFMDEHGWDTPFVLEAVNEDEDEEEEEFEDEESGEDEDEDTAQ